jgi:hypothetical protein
MRTTAIAARTIAVLVPTSRKGRKRSNVSPSQIKTSPARMSRTNDAAAMTCIVTVSPVLKAASRLAKWRICAGRGHQASVLIVTTTLIVVKDR